MSSGSLLPRTHRLRPATFCEGGANIIKMPIYGVLDVHTSEKCLHREPGRRSDLTCSGLINVCTYAPHMPHFILTTQLPSTSISTNVVNRLAMRTSCGLLFIALGPASVSAYLSPSGLGVCSSGLRPSVGRRSAGALQMEYIPDGLSKEQYQKIKTKDKANAANLGRVGVVRFKSRSFQAWQESGAGHLFPVDPKKARV